MLSWFFSSLRQQSADRHVAPLGHIILIPSHQYLLFLLNAACLAEKQQIPIVVFGLTRPGLEPMIYCTRAEHDNHYPTNVVKCNFRINLECPMGVLNYVKGAWVVLWLIHLNLFLLLICMESHSRYHTAYLYLSIVYCVITVFCQ